MSVNTEETSSGAERLGQEGLSSRVYSRLKQEVMRGRFLPSEKLKLRDLAAELGVSPTPVREALARLVSESALEQGDHRSVRVPLLSERTFREVVELRMELEGRAVQHAAERATAEDIEALINLQAQLTEARATGDPIKSMIANEEFHMRICEIADMPVLTRLIEGLWLRCGPVFRFMTNSGPLYRPSEHPHYDIIRGIRNRDGIMSKFAIQRDIISFSQSALNNIENINNSNETKT